MPNPGHATVRPPTNPTSHFGRHPAISPWTVGIVMPIPKRVPATTMYDEHDLIYSPLQQTYVANGQRVEIHIYRMPDTGWSLEVVDVCGNSTVWDDLFETDQEAFDTVMKELQDEGIDAIIGMPPGEATH